MNFKNFLTTKIQKTSKAKVKNTNKSKGKKSSKK